MKVKLNELMEAIADLANDFREDQRNSIYVNIEVVDQESEDTVVAVPTVKFETTVQRKKPPSYRDKGYTTNETITAEVFKPSEMQPPRVTRNIIKTLECPEEEKDNEEIPF